jgi:predicted PurR-regulated permease PerM
MLTQRVVEVFGPSEQAQANAMSALAKMVRSVRTYLIWRTVVNIGLGLVLGIVYQSVGLHHPWTWALVTAVLCYIPYIGTILAGAPPFFDAFVNLDPWWALGILVLYVVIVTFEGYFIVPWVMGRGMDLNATTVMLACLFWDLVWGTPGLFLAMPLMAALKAVCESVPGWRRFANLMGTDEAPAAPLPNAGTIEKISPSSAAPTTPT